MGRPFTTPLGFFKILHRTADNAVGSVELAFLHAVNVTVQSIDRARLTAALDARDVTEIFLAVNLNGQLAPTLRSGLQRMLQGVFNRAAIASAQLLPPVLQLNFQRDPLTNRLLDTGAFDLTNPRALLYARTRVGQLVTDVTTDTRQNIRTVIARGFREGRDVPTLTRDLMQVIGLRVDQRQALDARRAELLAAGLDDATVAFKAEGYATKLLRDRARLVARSETMDASTSGQRELWGQAVEKDLMAFAPDLPTMYRTPWGLLAGPIAHPQCRCTEGLKFVNGLAARFWIVTPDDRLCTRPGGGCAAIPALNPDGVGLLADQPLRRAA